MDAAKRNASLSIVSLGVGAIAAVLAVVALATRPVAPKPREASASSESATAAEVAGLKLETEQLRLAISPLSSRLKRLEAKLAERQRIESADVEMIRKVAMAALRENALRENGKASLPVDELPAGIKEAVTKAFPELALSGVEIRRTDNGLQYRIQGRYENDTWKMRLDENGEIVDAELPAKSTPQSVTETLNRLIPGATNDWINKRTRDGQVVFDVHAKVGETEYRLRIAEDGALIEAELPPSAAPAPALAAAKNAVQGIKFTEASAETDEGVTVYYLEGRIERDWYAVTVDGDGNVQSTEMPITRIPEVVSKAAAKAAKGTRLGRYASKSVEDGTTIYEIKGGWRGRGGRGGRGGMTIRITEAGEVVEVEGQGEENQGRGGRREGPPARPEGGDTF
jgi:hypothetical protein